MRTPEGDATLTALDRSTEPPLPVVDLVAGVKIGRYVVEQRLGAGGMGVVYSARDTELARDVALKIVRPRAEIDAMQARLRREAKAMARLSHRNVVPVFDIGTHEGQLFIAMELVAGETLRSWVARPRPWRAVVQLFVRAGRGLEAAHAAGLLHRDFKPDNVVVGQDGEPRITDFGLAREVGDGAAPASSPPRPGELSQVTATGSLAGTPAYMAPEQLLGKPCGPAADQFSFCVSLFEVLYGARPFRPAVPRPEALIAEIRKGRVARPAASRGVPGRIHAAIVRGLAFDPAQRWPSMAALVDALEGRRRARRVRLAAAAAGLVIVAAGAVALVAGLRGRDRSAPARCLDLALAGNDAVTILVCQDEYARTNDPWAGRELADALRRTGKLQQAATVATALLATPAQAGALYTLGKIADHDGRRDEAERSLRLASKLHREQDRWGDSAADLQALAQASDDVVDQLVGLDEAAADARRGGDARTEAYCHLAAALHLSEIGAAAGALVELERARSMMTQPGDAVLFDLKRGDVLQNLGDHARAVAAFDHARVGAETENNARLALFARLNLVYSLAESGRVADAAVQLRAAAALDPGDRLLAERESLEARVAARGGDLIRAAELIDRSIAATGEDATDDRVEREVARAEIALGRGELATAEQSARRAIALIGALRSTHPPVELRSWLITDRRIPYELLFASLARRGDAAGALEVFDRYRGLGVLAGLIHGRDAAGRPDAAFPAGDLARLLPALQSSALAAPRSERAAGEAVRTASLLVLVVAGDELWRITAQGGQLRIGSLGPLAALRPRLERLRTAPGDRAAAAELGALLVPAELARPSDQVLHVVLDEPVAALPVAALRVGDRPLIAARPIAELARPSDVGCVARPGGPRRVVVLDGGGLARRALGPAVDATRAALLDAARGDLLHVALPIESDALGDALVVRDGRVRALEIAGHGAAAAQVVLATPRAGPAGTAGLAMAFLAAGADQVIATVRPVPQAAIERLADRLYRADHEDLVRALARIQRAEDGAGDDDWLGLAAFGRATCNPQP